MEDRFSLQKDSEIIQLDLFVKKVPIVLQCFLVFIFMVSTLLPAVIIVSAAGSDDPADRPHFGAVIGILASLLIASFLARLFLWNAFGKEMFVLHLSGKVDYWCDYRYFKGRRKTFTFSAAAWYFVREADPELMHDPLDGDTEILGTGRLVLLTDNEMLDAQIALPISELRAIIYYLRPLFPYYDPVKEEENAETIPGAGE